MRNLQLLSTSAFHGAETMAAELVRQLSRAGHECYVAVFDNAGRGNREILAATRQYAAGTAVLPCRWQYDPRTVAAIGAYVRGCGISIVHSHKYKSTFHALRARHLAPFKLVATYHNWLTDTWQLKLYASIDKRLSRWCDANVAVSSTVAATLRAHAPANRVHYIPNGIDPGRFTSVEHRRDARRRLGLADRFTVGFVGRLDRLKGLRFLLAAIAEVSSGPLQVLIVGDGEDRNALEDQAHALGVADRVLFVGQQTDTPRCYCAMDLFVLPSLVEAFPMVLLEAMSCGLPTIATDVGDVHQIVQDGITGWIVPPGSSEALRNALERAVTTWPDIEQMGAEGRKRVAERFSSQRMSASYAGLYAALLDSSGRSTSLPEQELTSGSGS